MMGRALTGGTAVVLALCFGMAPPAAAQDQTALENPGAGRLGVELNKLEDSENGACRAFFLFRNQTGKTLSGFEMSLAILDGGGVIDRLLTIDAAPLPTGRTTLKLFEIPEIKCGNISEILLHEITSCQAQNESEGDCFGILDITSRANVAMVF